jgi:hypothetical protein
MKKMAQLMKEIGFNPDSSLSAQEAFLKYLIRQSTGSYVQTPTEKKLVEKLVSENVKIIPTQLSFVFDDEVVESPQRKKQKTQN